VTLLFAVALPPPGGAGVALATFVPSLVLITASALLLRPTRRELPVVWGLAPIVGIAVVAALDLITSDATVTGQVFLFYPVIYAASQLKAPVAGVTSIAAVVADAVVVLSLKPLATALTELGYVSAALLAVAALLVRAGQRQDNLVAELRRQAAIDSLTGLVTRRVLDDALQCALSSADRDDGNALMMLDIDRFKSINDRYGHPAGDAALVHIAGVLAAHSRPDTVICRLGGDEIGFLLPGCSRAVAAARAEHLVRAVRDNPLHLADGTQVALSVSVGVAHATAHTASMRNLYAEADAALYNAKRGGRDRVGTALVAS
jgi:diguanylate cyclase (GGDEF)-like protein